MVWWLLLVNDHKNLDIRSDGPSPSAVFSRRVKSVYPSRSNVSWSLINTDSEYAYGVCCLPGASLRGQKLITHTRVLGDPVREQWSSVSVRVSHNNKYEESKHKEKSKYQESIESWEQNTWERVTAGQAVRLTLYDHWDTDWGPGLLATCRMSQAPEYREFSPGTCDTSKLGPAAWEPATLNCGEWVDPEGNSEKVFKHIYFNSVKHFKIRVTPECAIMLVLLNIRNKFVKEYPHIFQTKQYIIIYFAISRERINIVYHVHLNRVRYPSVIDT